ncbi:hypothetical protein GWK48_07560 [Metallosphaera tengchongensis]|uniref:Uncharacterized protein n=1 Tax=Metallosphaera tengchongensis TaxID=1532350 RepID=A0A6N0NYT7_9CREN|nr:hypothetical protein [Metallosphaera tengchongensis]QKR00250.1 hypothetical protein GWK48_07560 [Metallosphaera tengchongensis]
MTKVTSTEIEKKRSADVLTWAKSVDNVISVIPNVVSVNGNTVKLKFTRMMFFSYESSFTINPSYVGSGLIEYKLVNGNNDNFKIIFVAEDRDKVKISLSYQGEKEWIVSKSLPAILGEIIRGVNKELSRARVEERRIDYSANLSKISFLSKLILKSKLVSSQEVTLNQGEVIDYLQQLISEFSEYPIIYISGSGSSSFRLLIVNGNISGVYLMKDGKEYFDEEILNALSGTFKVHVYTALSPKALEVIS